MNKTDLFSTIIAYYAIRYSKEGPSVFHTRPFFKAVATGFYCAVIAVTS